MPASRETRAPAATNMIKQQEQTLELEGTIKSELPSKHMVLAHISGRMRKRFIRLTTGDRVKLEMSPYDVDKARIVYRLG